eukprot:1144323-Pelagomonas_calceolata.AAC.3
MIQGMGSSYSHTQENVHCVVAVGLLAGHQASYLHSLPGWNCAAPCLFLTSHTAGVPNVRGRARTPRSDQDSIRAAGVASSLIRNTGVLLVVCMPTRFSTSTNLLLLGVLNTSHNQVLEPGASSNPADPH